MIKLFALPQKFHVKCVWAIYESLWMWAVIKMSYTLYNYVKADLHVDIHIQHITFNICGFIFIVELLPLKSNFLTSKKKNRKRMREELQKKKDLGGWKTIKIWTRIFLVVRLLVLQIYIFYTHSTYFFLVREGRIEIQTLT